MNERPVFAEEVQISYPLFGLRRAGTYVAYDLGTGAPSGTGMGLVVFTTEEKARRFLHYTEKIAEIKSFDRVAVFRKFLRSAREMQASIIFDLAVGEDGNLHSNRVFPAAVILERCLPEPGFNWGYPLYFLKVEGEETYRVLDGTLPDGTAVKMLAVFTDRDLADRAAATWAPSLLVKSFETAKDFGAWLRGPGAELAGVAFDASSPLPGSQVQDCLMRHSLLAGFEIDI